VRARCEGVKLKKSFTRGIVRGTIGVGKKGRIKEKKGTNIEREGADVRDEQES